jgi:hypothetical protein
MKFGDLSHAARIHDEQTENAGALIVECANNSSG